LKMSEDARSAGVVELHVNLGEIDRFNMIG
jgi:hypothetical protein